MLHKASELRDYTLRSNDGDVGNVSDFYFDDNFWTVRYMVVDTRGWLDQRQVLISPYAIAGIEDAKKVIRVNLTKKQIKESPTPDTDPPVSRQFEIDYHDYYGWPYYWYGLYSWGTLTQPLAIPRGVSDKERESWDPYSRSTREVHGYKVAATDGHIGHVADFIVDDETWTIRYLVIDPRTWWPGKHVLMAPDWVEKVDWATRSMSVKLSRELIRGAPEYDHDTRITREYEERLHRHYESEGYWISEDRLA
jgi:uncharacterized protein YrrD